MRYPYLPVCCAARNTNDFHEAIYLHVHFILIITLYTALQFSSGFHFIFVFICYFDLVCELSTLGIQLAVDSLAYKNTTAFFFYSVPLFFFFYFIIIYLFICLCPFLAGLRLNDDSVSKGIRFASEWNTKLAIFHSFTPFSARNNTHTHTH